MDRFQLGKDKCIVQSEGAKRWLKIQETTKGAKVPKISGPTDRRKRKMEGNKENPLQSISRGDLT